MLVWLGIEYIPLQTSEYIQSLSTKEKFLNLQLDHGVGLIFQQGLGHKLLQRRHQGQRLSCYKEGQAGQSLSNLHERRNMAVPLWTFHHPMQELLEPWSRPHWRVQAKIPPPRTDCIPVWRGRPRNASPYLDRMLQIHKGSCHTTSPMPRWFYQVSHIESHCVRFHTTQRTPMTPQSPLTTMWASSPTRSVSTYLQDLSCSLRSMLLLSHT